jgi:hypothetical protein
VLEVAVGAVSALTAGQTSILAALKLPEPPRFFDFTAASD